MSNWLKGGGKGKEIPGIKEGEIVGPPPPQLPDWKIPINNQWSPLSDIIFGKVITPLIPGNPLLPYTPNAAPNAAPSVPPTPNRTQSIPSVNAKVGFKDPSKKDPWVTNRPAPPNETALYVVGGIAITLAITLIVSFVWKGKSPNPKDVATQAVIP